MEVQILEVIPSNLPTFQDDYLFVDPNGYIVKLNGESVHLTATEHRLLACLVANAGRLLTHRQILCSVWGFEYIDDLDYVRIYIWRLRHKVEPDPTHPKYITGVNGLGYRFENKEEVKLK